MSVSRTTKLIDSVRDATPAARDAIMRAHLHTRATEAVADKETSMPNETIVPYQARQYDGVGKARVSYHVVGPYIAGGWDGTVPKSHDGMSRQNAEWLADLLNRAYSAGRDDAQRTMRLAIGMKD